jgi:hypothetical protein
MRRIYRKTPSYYIPGTKTFRILTEDIIKDLFTYGDLIKNKKALRYGIENIPTLFHWENLERLSKYIIEPIFKHFSKDDLRIRECYYTLELSKLIGKTRSFESAHNIGTAVDIELNNKNITLMNVFKWIINNLNFNTLIAEYFPDGWIHIEYNEEKDFEKKIFVNDNVIRYRRISEKIFQIQNQDDNIINNDNIEYQGNDDNDIIVNQDDIDYQDNNNDIVVDQDDIDYQDDDIEN